MRALVYAMRFTGQVTPVGIAGDVLEATTTGSGSTLTTTIGPDGLAADLETLPGGEATFASEVTFTGETRFQETGTIAFGDHRLRFSTVGSGYLAPGADPRRQQGAVVWRVESGEGQFAGATGLITSNFFVGDDGAVVDHHLGVVILP